MPPTAVEPATVAETLKLAGLLEEANQPIAAMLMHISVASGARKGELLALTWSDVDLDRGALIITRAVWEAGGILGSRTSRRTPPAGGASISRPIASPACAPIASGGGSAKSKADGPGTQTISCFRASKVVAPVARDSCRPADRNTPQAQDRLHDRWHTHAVLLMEVRVPVKVIADRLGHADPAMTLKVYQHLTDQAVAAALDEALTAPPQAEMILRSVATKKTLWTRPRKCRFVLPATMT